MRKLAVVALAAITVACGSVTPEQNLEAIRERLDRQNARVGVAVGDIIDCHLANVGSYMAELPPTNCYHQLTDSMWWNPVPLEATQKETVNYRPECWDETNEMWDDSHYQRCHLMVISLEGLVVRMIDSWDTLPEATN